MPYAYVGSSKQILDAEKAGAIPPLLCPLQPLENSSSVFPQEDIPDDDLYYEGYNYNEVWDSWEDKPVDQYPNASSMKMAFSQLASNSLFTSNQTTPNSTYNMTPNMFGNSPNNSYSNLFNNSQKSTSVFGGSGFGKGFSDLNYGPTSYPSNIYPNNQSQPFGQSSNLFKNNNINNNLQSTIQPLFNNQPPSATIFKKIEPNATNIIFNNNTKSLIQEAKSNSIPNKIFSEQNIISSSTTNQPQQKTQVKTINIFAKQKKAEYNIFKKELNFQQFLPKSPKDIPTNIFKDSSQLYKLSKTSEENNPFVPLNCPPNTSKSQTSVSQNDAKKQQQKSTIQVKKCPSFSDSSFQEEQEPPQPKKQAKEEKNSINPSLSGSNSSQNSKKEQENLQQSDHSEVENTDSPVLIDFNEKPSSEDTVFIIPSNQSESTKVNELKETMKTGKSKKLTISQDSEQSDQVEKLRLRVKELEEMNKNYLKVIGDLSETVKNLSIGLIQKNKTEIELKKVDQQTNQAQQ